MAQVHLERAEDCFILEGETRQMRTYKDLPSNAKIIHLVEDRGAIALNTLAETFQCASCSACKPIRINLDEYTPTDRHKKLLRQNADLQCDFIEGIAENISAKDQDTLYALYLRHNYDRFAKTAEESIEDTTRFKANIASNDAIMIIRDDKQEIIGFETVKFDQEAIVGITQTYAPEENKRSLGTLIHLKLIELAQERDISFFYMGALNLKADGLKHLARYNGCEVFNRASQDWVAIPRNANQEDFVSLGLD